MADRYIIRRLRASDLDELLEIEHASFGVPWSRASFEQELKNRCARYLVLEHGGVVCAYAGMWVVIDEGHITNIAVHPDHRGKGYGEAITCALMRLASAVGITWMTLEVRRSNAVAQGLYRKLGFQEVGYRKRYYSDNNEDALVMYCEHLPEADAQAERWAPFEAFE